jgi:hypothetical protein
MMGTCIKKFRTLTGVDICKQIFMYLSSYTFVYNKILHKCEFCQAHCVELPKMSLTKFSLPFLDIPTSFYGFWKFETIFEII